MKPDWWSLFSLLLNVSPLIMMKKIQWNKINAIIASATIALIALIVLQGKWLLHSKNLIEEQFNQKVSMALCMSITELSDGPKSCIASPEPTFMDALDIDKLMKSDEGIEITAVTQSLDRALAFYDITTTYDLEIIDEQNTCVDEASPGCCSLGTVAGFNNKFLNITFPNRTAYVLERMGFMIGASIVILLFISSVFWLAATYLIEQKRIGERNKDFFNNMAHEFKTPLTNIILATNLIAKKDTTLKENVFLNITKKEANKLKNQVERVLYLAKMEKKEYTLHKVQLNLNQLIQEVIGDMAIQVQEKQASIEVLFNKDLIIMGDKFHLSNAFRNIIDNALKYSSENPKLIISFKEQGNGILLLFQDNGIGISKSNQQIVFNKFERVSTQDIHNEKGFGLGLAYVKKVIELHQGFIQIFSELNKGSRFDLFLPTTH